LIQKDPELIKAIMRALIQTRDFIKTQPEKAAELLSKELKTSMLVAREATAVLVETLSTSIVPTDELHEGQAKLVSTFGDRVVTAEMLRNIWDVSLAREVEAEAMRQKP
jgi:ABC-type nitrate/sulfonate/bicarbonate transport system substrate-binding protein